MEQSIGDVLMSHTTALCPQCLDEVPGAYFESNGKVELRRTCPEHGMQASRFWADADHYRHVMHVESTARATGQGSCCAPGTAGCGGDPDNRRCVTVLPITDGCNLECPYCFASSAPGQGHRSIDEIQTMLAGALRASDGPAPLQLSGGEPTTHPELLKIVALARDLGFLHIEVNTNGVLLASRPELARQLKKAGVSALYLQFDGMDDDAYQTTRATGLVEVKRQALERAREAGLNVVLVPTLVKGRNDDQIGAILRFAVQNVDVVRGVNFQPVRHFGRYVQDTGHLSLDEVATKMAEQTQWLQPDEVWPVPCCSATCYLATVFVPVADGAVPLTRFFSETMFYQALDNVGERRYMEVLAGTPEGLQVAEDVACACGIPFDAAAKALTSKALMVSVTGFMDAHTADVDRMGRCCINVVTGDGSLAPFCGYYLTDAKGRYAWRQRNTVDGDGAALARIVTPSA